jgi:hypothetical protein
MWNGTPFMKNHIDTAEERASFPGRLDKAISQVLPARAKKYSLQKKADLFGFSKTFMADLMAGRKMPSAANIMSMAIITGVKADWLWTGRGPMVEILAQGYLYIGDLQPNEQELLKLLLKSYQK